MGGVSKNVFLAPTHKEEIALPNDSDNVFLTLTARELNPRLRVTSRAFSQDAVGKLHSAGADVVVVPEIVGGLELARGVMHSSRASHESKLVSIR